MLTFWGFLVIFDGLRSLKIFGAPSFVPNNIRGLRRAKVSFARSEGKPCSARSRTQSTTEEVEKMPFPTSYRRCPAPGMPDVDPPKDPIVAAFEKAAKTIISNDQIRLVHSEAIEKLERAGFRQAIDFGAGFVGGTARLGDASLRRIFLSIRWEGAGGEQRYAYPELVTQACARAGQGLEKILYCPPEESGASILQLEILRGLEIVFSEAKLSLPYKWCGLWLRKFMSDGTRVIRVPIVKTEFHTNRPHKETLCVVAELRFWDDFPSSENAKPI